MYTGLCSSLTAKEACRYLLNIDTKLKQISHYCIKCRMVLPLSEPLTTSGTEGFTPGGRFSTWAVTAIDSVYSVLAIGS